MEADKSDNKKNQKRPNRPWRKTHQLLASSVIENGEVKIYNIRDFRYPSGDENNPEVRFINKTFPINTIESTWLSCITFRPRFAHLIVSFGISDGTYIAISVEIRYKENDPYILWKTFTPHYWLSYVIATEEDVLRLRTDVRKNELVYTYRLALSPEESQNLFLDMIKRAEKVNHHSPERFNSAYNSCTSNTISHISQASKRKLPFHFSHYFTSSLDRYLAKEGFFEIKGKLSEESREKHFINEVAKNIPTEAKNFSAQIRRAFI